MLFDLVRPRPFSAAFLFFVSCDGDRSLFLDVIVSSCAASSVFVAVVAYSIGTSMVRTTDFSDLFDSEMIDTSSVLVGVFGRFFCFWGAQALLVSDRFLAAASAGCIFRSALLRPLCFFVAFLWTIWRFPFSLRL